MNLDVLVKYLRKVDLQAYDSNLTCRVLKHLGCLDDRTQRVVIKTALQVNISYQELVEHVRKQFKILKHEDDIGKYCGLGYGEDCVSVATWSGWQNPKHAKDVDVTQVCYKDSNGVMRCGHLLDFAEMWMDMNDASFQEFLKGLEVRE